MLTKSESINELMAAVVRAQQVLQPAKKDASNPFYHSKYADLPAVWEALAPFRNEGIAFVQCPADAPDGYLALETFMAHASSGQWIASRLVVPLAKNDPQGAGSALTYARRYALGCMSGLVTEEDDDGNAASHAPKKAQVAVPQNNSVDCYVQPSPHIHQQGAGFIWKVGKEHKDESIATIPGDYLDWFVKNGKRDDHVEAAIVELDLRRGQGTVPL